MANGKKSESEVRLPSRKFDENFDQVFGPRGVPQRGKWWLDPFTGHLVDHPVEAPRACGLQINTDTHYEGAQATDGTDLSTRARHKAYMAQHGLTLASDFKETWKQQEKVRKSGDDPTRRQDVIEAVKHPEHRRHPVYDPKKYED